MPVKINAQNADKPRRGPLPVSRNGKLPGGGMGQAAHTNRFATWLKIKRVRNLWRGTPMDQVQFARLIGVSPSILRKMEQGVKRPTYEQLTNIAEVFREDLDDVCLKAYVLPMDMQMFLTCTVEGEKIVKRIRATMETIENKDGFHVKPYVNDMEWKERYHWDIERNIPQLISMEDDAFMDELMRRVQGDDTADTGT